MYRSIFALLILITVKAAAQQSEGQPAFSAIDSARIKWAQSIPPQLKRTQVPAPPYHYVSEDGVFVGKETGLTYGFTLTKPVDVEHFPTVILIDGTGPEDRDYTAYYHKYFWVLADYLSSHGIAVLRMDDRGVGMSTGNYASSTTMDFAKDMHAAVSWLRTRKDIDPGNIGLVGHSEGGIIAPMTYAMEPVSIRFMVLLAPPVVGLRAINRFQSSMSFRHAWKTDSLAQAQMRLHESIVSKIPAPAHDSASLQQVLVTALTAFCKTETPQTLQQLMVHNDQSGLWSLTRSYQGFLSPWWLYILSYDPLTDICKIKCPVLGLFGDKDLQVPPVADYELLKATLPANALNTVSLLPDVNHFMQPQKEGTSIEYGFNETTIAPVVLEQVTAWINHLQAQKIVTH